MSSSFSPPPALAPGAAATATTVHPVCDKDGAKVPGGRLPGGCAQHPGLKLGPPDKPPSICSGLSSAIPRFPVSALLPGAGGCSPTSSQFCLHPGAGVVTQPPWGKWDPYPSPALLWTPGVWNWGVGWSIFWDLVIAGANVPVVPISPGHTPCSGPVPTVPPQEAVPVSPQAVPTVIECQPQSPHPVSPGTLPEPSTNVPMLPGCH